MTMSKGEKNKKLFFHGAYVYCPDQYGKRQRATDLGWEFARAALRGEPVHLLDGFIFHESWRQQDQDGQYLALFRSNKAKAEQKLKALEIQGARIKRRYKTDLYTWQFYPPADGLECNVTEAVKIARQAQEEFRKSNTLAWDLVRHAYEKHPDPRSICQALFFANAVPKDLSPNENQLHGVNTLIADYGNTLLQALYKVLCLASEGRQGITEQIGNLAIDCWVEEFFQLKQVLSLISGHKPYEPQAFTSAIEEFASLVKRCRNSNHYVQELKGKLSQKYGTISEAELNLAEDDAEKDLKRLVHCRASIEAAEKAVLYFEQQPRQHIDDRAVYDELQNAVQDFLLRFDYPIHDPNLVYFRFSQHLLIYIRKSNKGQGIKSVLKSHKNRAEKRQQFQIMLENMVDQEKTRHKLKRLFDITGQRFSTTNEFTTIPCRGICPQDSSHYIQPIDTVLQPWRTDSEWFRRTGPIAADFRTNKIYRRVATREYLKRLVLGNPISLLLGESDTGKTVLTRDFAYELTRNDHFNVYHFDCSSQRDFDPSSLAIIIDDMKGVVIFDDIHLFTRGIQLLCSKLLQKHRENTDIHILLVGRPSYVHTQDPRIQKLDRLPTLNLNRFGPVGRIIDHYFRYSTDGSLIAEQLSLSKDMIKSNSKKSLWLLALTLKGYCLAAAKSHPTVWQKEAVEQIFAHLKNCGDPHARQYPKIIVALAPLYKNEVMTEEKYLINHLGLDPEALDDLVNRGEITTSKTSYGATLYGLPHSALADAYWKHGIQYRDRLKLSTIWAHAFNYARSNTPNGLEAVLSLPTGSSKLMLSSLKFKSCLEEVLRNEQSTETICYWLYSFHDQQPVTDEIVEIIRDKLSSTDHLYQATALLWGVGCMNDSALRRFYKSNDIRRLFEKYASKVPYLDLLFFISAVYYGNHKLGLSLWRSIRQSRAWNRLMYEANLKTIQEYLINAGVHSEISREVCNSLSLKLVAEKMAKSTNMENVADCIHAIRVNNPASAKRVCDLLQLEIFAGILSKTEDIPCITHFIRQIRLSNKPRCWELCELLELNSLGQALRAWNCPEEKEELVRAIFLANEDKGLDLVELTAMKFYGLKQI